jgi:rhamnosyl/mannosyltransferase
VKKLVGDPLVMRVVHVGKYYPPYRGGIETVVEQLSRGLARRGVDVTALVSNDGPETVDETLQGVRVIRLARSALINSQPFNLGLRRALRELAADVVHFHTPNPLGALTLLSTQPTAASVVTHHSDVVRQKVLGVAATAAHALFYARCDAIVAPTPRHIQHSRLLSRFQHKATVIHLPIDKQPYGSATPHWDEALPSDWQDQPLALFVGRLVYYKGLDVLLNAMASIAGMRLAIVGTGALERELRDLSGRLGLDRRVLFMGALSDERLRGLYKCARVLVLPSTAPSEAFGMVQLEAMASGCPVVSTNLKSGVPYVNRDGETGIVVPPGDVPSLVAALERLRDDDAHARRLGAAGLLRVEQEFDIERVVDQHLALYAKLMAAGADAS